LTLTVDSVTTEGETTVTVTPEGLSPPTGFEILGQHCDTETTAVFHGPVEVCFSYDDTGLSEADEQALELLHHENDDWQDITTSLDMGFNIICGEVTEVSEFVIAFPTVTDSGIDGDVNGDDSVNAIDVQLVINAALGIDTICSCDINGDGPVNAVDVQLVINAVLGIGI
jgi:hypothetical protein